MPRTLYHISFLLVGMVLLFPVSCPAQDALSFSEEVIALGRLIDQSAYLEVLERGPVLLEKLRLEFPAGTVDEAKVLDFMVNACYRSRQVMNPDALAWGARAVLLKENLLGPDSPELANSLMHQGNLFSRRWEPEKSIPFFDRAVAILEKAGPDHDAKRAINLSSQGVAYRRMGDNRKSMDLYGQALALQVKALGPDHPEVASTLNNQAVVYTEWGDYSAAVELHRRAMAIREKHLGPDHEWVGESANNLANQLGYLGEFEEALAVQERAVDIFARKLGKDHQRYWMGFMNLGITYQDMGDHDEAIVILTQVAEGMEARFGTANPSICYALDALAISYHAIGQSAEALAYCTRSLGIAEAYYGVGTYETADTIGLQGKCLIALGRFDEAVERLTTSLEVFRKDLDEDNAVLCNGLNQLAEVYLQMEDYPQALAQANVSRDLCRRDLGEDHPFLAMSTLLMGRAYQGLGQEDEALAAALLAEDVSRRHLNQTMPVLSEHRALHYAASRVDGLDLALSLLRDGEEGTRVAQVWDAVSRSRAGVLDQYAARNRDLSRNLDPEGAALLDSTLVLRERLANLTLRGPGWEEVSVYQQLLDETRADLVSVERQLSLLRSSGKVEGARQEIGYQEIASSLPDDAALVAYHRGTTQDDRTAYYAFLLKGHGSEPQFFELGLTSAIDQAVEAWRDQATFGVRSVRSDNARSEDQITMRGFIKVPQSEKNQGAAYFKAGDRLRQLIWDRLAGQLGSAETVFLVADGSLHLVSFPSLPVTEDRYLLEEKWLLHNLTAEKTLATLGVDTAGNPRLLVIGGVHYGDLAKSDAQFHSPEPRPDSRFSALSFTDLPQAAIEVERVQEIWASQGRPSVYLTGFQATEQAAKTGMPQAGVVHLATHGFFLPGSKMEAESAHWENPLTRSGLALSGANSWQTADSGSSDGILTAEEIAALDLSQVDWAVLSACDTGLGELAARGEGVMGLRRAFALAGARTVIMSLWSIDDQTTRQWMESLYRTRWQEKSSTAEAVRQASLELLAQRRSAGLSDHPFYWAGFMAAGEWR